MRCGFVIMLFVLMAGCGTKHGSVKTSGSEAHESSQSMPEVENRGAVLEAEEQVIIVPAPKNKKYQVTPVVQSLLEKSVAKFKVGQLAQAANLLERGINISPNNPQLWQRLAMVRFKQQNYQQAKQLAIKSNVLVEGVSSIREINNHIIRRSNLFLAP